MSDSTNESSNSMLVTGATGFVGAELISQTPNSIAVSRNAQSASRKLDLAPERVLQWDCASPFPVQQLKQPVHSFVNLMGESIAHGRWTEAKKKRIRDSRIAGTRHIVDSMIEHQMFPKVFVSASAIGYYGNSGELEVGEQFPPGDGFLTDVCVDWEQEALRLEAHGVRVVLLRIGIVIGKEGGAFKEMAPLFKWGLGGKLGNGRQWMSWIHVNDLVSLVQFCVDQNVTGPVNATAPNPVRNADFTQAIARQLNRFAILPAPKFAVRLMLGEFADSLFFSQRILPIKAQDAGFEFEFDCIETALADVDS